MFSSRLTIRQALEIDPLSRAKIIAGKKGLENIVRGVNVMEVPDIQKWIHPDELLITTLYPLSDKNIDLIKLIHTFSEHELSGMAIKFNRYISPFPKDVLAIADQLYFPIIEMPDDIAFVDVIQSVTSKILELNTIELEKSIAIHKQFIELVLQGGGFSEIAFSTSNLIQYPVTIIDIFQKVLASSVAISSILTQDCFEEYKDEYYLTAKFSSNVSILNKGEIIELKSIRSENNRLKFDQYFSYPIQIGTTSPKLGEIIIWKDRESSIDIDSLPILENCAVSIALKLMEMKNNRQTKVLQRKEIFDGLLSEHRNQQEIAIAKARELNYLFPVPFIVLIMQGISSIESKSLYEDYQRNDEFFFQIKRKIRSMNHNVIFWTQGSKLIMYFPSNNQYPLNHPKDLNLILDRLNIFQDEGFFKDYSNSMSIGISNIESDIYNFPYAYHCAQRSLNVGKILADQKGWNITKFSEIGILRFVGLNENQGVLKRYCDETIGKLVQYDIENGTDNLKTVKAFLDNNQNIKKTASSLYIHYNTVKYRIKKAIELIGDFINSPQERLAIEFALQIHQLIDYDIEEDRN